MNRAIIPTSIRQRGKSELAVSWGDGHESVYAVRRLRLACQCAACVHEVTRVPLIDLRAVPDDVRPVKIDPVGRYGIQIEWSDGHKTGIATFRDLRALCACSQCSAKVSDIGP